jgi:uncharacterized protein YdaU (DUF1376 family)
MNYYPHHIGDYASATAHLSALEDCYYRRLLDWYYLDEKPILVDRRAVYRRVRAASDGEREAVDVVLFEFFDLTEEGYRHGRCDAEIARSKAKSDERRQAANRSWDARRAKPAQALQSKPHANASPEHANASPEGAFAMHSQEPITNSQEPKEEKERARAVRVVKKPDDVPDAVWQDFQTIRKAKRSPLTETALAGIAREAEAAGLPLVRALEICCQNGWQGFKADWVGQQRSRSPPVNEVQQRRRDMMAAIGGGKREVIDAEIIEIEPRRIG